MKKRTRRFLATFTVVAAGAAFFMAMDIIRPYADAQWVKDMQFDHVVSVASSEAGSTVDAVTDGAVSAGKLAFEKSSGVIQKIMGTAAASDEKTEEKAESTKSSTEKSKDTAVPDLSEESGTQSESLKSDQSGTQQTSSSTAASQSSAQSPAQNNQQNSPSAAPENSGKTETSSSTDKKSESASDANKQNSSEKSESANQNDALASCKTVISKAVAAPVTKANSVINSTKKADEEKAAQEAAAKAAQEKAAQEAASKAAEEKAAQEAAAKAAQEKAAQEAAAKAAQEKAAQEAAAKAAQEKAAQEAAAKAAQEKAAQEAAAKAAQQKAAQEAAAKAAQQQAAITSAQKRAQVASFARQFVGYPYKWGGTDPTRGGADCSGFVYYVYRHFGYNVPRLGFENYYPHVSYSNLQPGDIIRYDTHYTIYLGNGQEISAENERNGVQIRSMSYRYGRMISICRVIL
ncbi:MAG: NlpC/P60 family protein [Baileyella intestinalis]|uniref:C40 family peptidase n=1 Tax=Baileyella intestinalis TaxID=2606709 RepID=UPI002A74CEC2|nr:NlpC/P60 family protein [Baileyella intestinalis]MDY2995168.1 NlpC/P60 family protein [Baileyella intestinalis]